MKLSSFGISNFKAFGQNLQSVPIKPITLVFGANSAGKSSLLHSFLWLNHAINRGETDIFNPVASGKSIDLGGYKACVNRKSDSDQILFEIEIPNPKLKTEVKTIFSNVRSFRLQLKCGRIGKTEFPSLVYCAIHADGKLLLETRQLRHKFAVSVKWDHSAISDFINLSGDQKKKLCHIDVSSSYELLCAPFFPKKLFPDEFMEVFTKGKSKTMDTFRSLVLRELPSAVSDLFENMGKPISDMLYLPPLREIPERSVDFRACELPGWRWLMKRPELVKRINETLERLKFDHRIHLRKLMPVDALESSFIAATCHAEAGDDWGALSHAVERARSEWEFYNYDEKRKWAERHPKFFNQMVKYWHENLIDDPSMWDGYYQGNPEAKTDERPTDAWLRQEAERLAWTFVNDWDSDAGTRFYSDAVRLHISEDRDVRDALAGALGGRALKDYIESSVERVELRLYNPKNDVWAALQGVGVGTSQSLPIILEAYAQQEKLIAIEQPELHLHPALQAELGDVFIESALGENKNTFLLETHSEHLILRILRRIRETTEGEMDDWPEALRRACPNGIRPEDVAVLYVKPGEDGAQVETLRINELGEFVDEWPGGFFDERIREIL